MGGLEGKPTRPTRAEIERRWATTLVRGHGWRGSVVGLECEGGYGHGNAAEALPLLLDRGNVLYAMLTALSRAR